MARRTNEERHEAVLDAATEALRSRGVHGTSMHDIADAAGISKSTLFHYFGSRADLFERLQARLSRISSQELSEVNDSPHLSPLEQLRELLHIHAHHCVERVSSPVLISFIQFWDPPTTEVGRAQLDVRRDYERAFERAIKRSIEAGELRDCDPRTIALAMLGMTTWVAIWYQPDHDPPLHDLVETYFEMCVNGLTPDNSR